MIVCVETFITDVIVFIGIKRQNVTSYWLIFSSLLDTDNDSLKSKEKRHINRYILIILSLLLHY